MTLLHNTENTGTLKPMPSVRLEADAARRQLDKILQSQGFARNERLSRLLRFVVDQHLAGREDELKESRAGQCRPGGLHYVTSASRVPLASIT